MSANTVTFLDEELLASTAYSYRISIHEGAGNFSSYSECVSATTGAAGTPHKPIELRAFSRSKNRVDLSWYGVSRDETTFKIYRQAGFGGWTLLDTAAEGIQSYNDTTAAGNDGEVAYGYDVRACNGSGCPMANPPLFVPFRPVDAAVTAASGIHLTWKDKSTNESGFEIYRKNGACASEKPWVVLRRVAAGTTAYEDTSAVPATTYSYKVRACYRSDVMPQTSGFSAFTGCFSATAP